jgi:SNF2 family DNA or RNA helicase
VFRSPKGLFPHQEEAVPHFVLRPINLKFWDAGTGKTVAAIVTACLLFEDDLIDRVVVCCEQTKIQGKEGSDLSDGWVDEFRRFSDLTVGSYHGPRRLALLENPPQVLISTYETIRNDAYEIVPDKKGRKTKQPKAFGHFIVHQRVLWIYDEIDKKIGGSRTSQTYKAHQWIVKETRKHGEYRAMGETATPTRKDTESTFNFVRLIAPEMMPTVKDFGEHYVKSYDFFGNPSAFHNIDATFDSEVIPFNDLLAPIVHIKHKTDPDLIDFFPKRTEKFSWVGMTGKQRDFYHSLVKALRVEDDEERKDGLYTVLRQISAHPGSLLRSEGNLAREIVDTVGEKGLLALGSGKTDALIDMVCPLVERQGDQVVVFTFFASAIPFLEMAFKKAGIQTAVHHGQQTKTANQEALHAFRSGEVSVLISSDAGERGLNLPQAAYLINYELPELHSTYTQRIGRNSRLTSKHPSVSVVSLILRDTVEERIADKAYRRNKQADEVMPGAKITAKERRQWMRAGK